ncbi:MAG: hypothetical protein QGG88_10155, partial [Gammaproteobacteria bacterium]|nr:hypothetical protein [Gammaproteobacteria bacterium]
MLTNFYPISTKHLPVNRFSLLSQIAKAFKAINLRSPISHTPPTAATQYNHLGQWAEDFNHQLAGHQATIGTDNKDIKIYQSGKLGQLRLYGDMGLLQGGDIDTYFYTENWRNINHQQDDMHGSLICSDDSQHQAWQLNSTHLNTQLAYQNLSLSLPEPQATIQQVAPTSVETSELRQMWASLTQVHQFYDMLSLFKLGLLDAIKLMQGQWTQPISRYQLTRFLQQCLEHNLDSKILAGNRGIVHVLKSPILHLNQDPNQLTVSGHNYRCEVNLQAIKQVWLVKRATKQGIVHSLEAFDCHDRLILQVQEQRQ